MAESILDVPFKADLVHQVVRGHLARSRRKVARTKDRSEVAGSNSKPWPQKGVGRARHGSRQSPIWVGGGVTFGPRPAKKFTRRLPEKMRRRALLSVLSQKNRGEELAVVEDLQLQEVKTKALFRVLREFCEKVFNVSPADFSSTSIAVVVVDSDTSIFQAGRNIPNVRSIPVDSLNTIHVLKYKYFIITKGALKKLEDRYAR